MNEYIERNLLLDKLGYPSYSHYLGSELWKSIRTRVLTAANGKCFCKREATQVHHQDYRRETLTGNNITTLTAICSRCHKKVEFTKSGRKRTLRQANGKLCAMQKRRKQKKCSYCGKHKPVKGKEHCRPCRRLLRLKGEAIDHTGLPLCKGEDCTHQAAKGSDYCRIHKDDPTLPLKTYMEFKRLARKAGVQV